MNVHLPDVELACRCRWRRRPPRTAAPAASSISPLTRSTSGLIHDSPGPVVARCGQPPPVQAVHVVAVPVLRSCRGCALRTADAAAAPARARRRRCRASAAATRWPARRDGARRQGRGRASPRRPTRSACRTRSRCARTQRSPSAGTGPSRSMRTRLSRVSSRASQRSNARTSSADTGRAVLDRGRPGAAHQVGRDELLALRVRVVDQFVIGVAHGDVPPVSSPGMSTVMVSSRDSFVPDQALGIGVRAARAGTACGAPGRRACRRSRCGRRCRCGR